jgi:dienelactone hydrolase
LFPPTVGNILTSRLAEGSSAESDQIVAAMRKNGKPVEYIVFLDEGHGFARPENRLIFYAAAEPFLAKYLGGRAEPPSEKEKADAFRK